MDISKGLEVVVLDLLFNKVIYAERLSGFSCGFFYLRENIAFFL